ncbi:MAG: hypothetical protein EOQ95_23740 [Mesorhizobium sp.]|nr:MAG: hypothetical protein EOQ95_23740 [Mesorhizobium sp.]RWQ47890.1 MAG: hypothetical protein EOS84_27720 [Mesorhizobium sp.]
MPSQATPLWPAGHLPLKGGDWQFRRRLLPVPVGNWRKPSGNPISPLEGEMSGRTEGGAVEPSHLENERRTSGAPV